MKFQRLGEFFGYCDGDGNRAQHPIREVTKAVLLLTCLLGALGAGIWWMIPKKVEPTNAETMLKIQASCLAELDRADRAVTYYAEQIQREQRRLDGLKTAGIKQRDDDFDMLKLYQAIYRENHERAARYRAAAQALNMYPQERAPAK
ncbi:hypothetical protein [Geothrix edaphica]|uniref:hypothetical protein n=1 Tax=Geothrix edaphica TaxID=2927976 RepID=UPI002557C0A8|nr:hypothetical protein [Geothrix edaphica]